MFFSMKQWSASNSKSSLSIPTQSSSSTSDLSSIESAITIGIYTGEQLYQLLLDMAMALDSYLKNKKGGRVRAFTLDDFLMTSDLNGKRSIELSVAKRNQKQNLKETVKNFYNITLAVIKQANIQDFPGYVDILNVEMLRGLDEASQNCTSIIDNFKSYFSKPRKDILNTQKRELYLFAHKKIKEVFKSYPHENIKNSTNAGIIERIKALGNIIERESSDLLFKNIKNEKKTPKEIFIKMQKELMCIDIEASHTLSSLNNSMTNVFESEPEIIATDLIKYQGNIGLTQNICRRIEHTIDSDMMTYGEKCLYIEIVIRGSVENWTCPIRRYEGDQQQLEEESNVVEALSRDLSFIKNVAGMIALNSDGTEDKTRDAMEKLAGTFDLGRCEVMAKEKYQAALLLINGKLAVDELDSSNKETAQERAKSHYNDLLEHITQNREAAAIKFYIRHATKPESMSMFSPKRVIEALPKYQPAVV